MSSKKSLLFIIILTILIISAFLITYNNLNEPDKLSAFKLPDGTVIEANAQKIDPCAQGITTGLYQIIRSEKNPKKTAESWDIYFKNDKVRVVIEFYSSEREIPEKFKDKIEIESEVESEKYKLIKALVPISLLCELKEEKGIKFIREPYKPIPTNL